MLTIWEDVERVRQTVVERYVGDFGLPPGEIPGQRTPSASMSQTFSGVWSGGREILTTPNELTFRGGAFYTSASNAVQQIVVRFSLSPSTHRTNSIAPAFSAAGNCDYQAGFNFTFKNLVPQR